MSQGVCGGSVGQDSVTQPEKCLQHRRHAVAAEADAKASETTLSIRCFLLVLLFIYFGCVGSWLLRALSLVGASRGSSLLAVLGLLNVVASLVVQLRL